ncbi:MAG: phosphatidate cytidylyltransferase [Planctomycetes bacterium]|nr:phosphatidate cytidylyltransferase [Planctomycetota bacterium]
MALDTAGKRALRTRLIIGPTLIAVIATVFVLDRSVTHGRAAAGLLYAIAMISMFEYVTMMRGAGFPVGRRLSMFAALVLHAMPFFFDSWSQLDTELYPVVIVTLSLLGVGSVRALTRTRMARGLEELGANLLGFVLIAWPLFFAQGLALRNVDALFWAVVVAKCGDIGGYFVGIAIGRRKFIPHVSPGKSLEGCIGSLVFACIVGALLAPMLLHRMTGLDTILVIGLSAVVNLMAQLGDLVESLLKRRCGVKDSSHMLPEHGGMLDLVDSLLFALPAFFFVIVRIT